MKRTTFVHIDGLPYAVTRDQLTDVLLSGGRRRYAIVDETLEEPGLCIKHVRLIDEDTDTVERLLATDGDTLEKEPTQSKSPWIPVTERLPKKGEDGRDGTWVHCIVSVMRTYGGNWADGDVGTSVFSAPAMFDVDQKIWHVGTKPAEFTVNALIRLEDSSDDYFVTHWMLYPKPPQEGT